MEAFMKKIALVMVLSVLSAGFMYAQDANAFAGISFENGKVMYHGVQPDLLSVGGFLVKSSDVSEFSTYQNGSDTIIVIKSKKKDMIEYSLKAVKCMIYDPSGKQITIVL
jgi:hypothetical protein